MLLRCLPLLHGFQRTGIQMAKRPNTQSIDSPIKKKFKTGEADEWPAPSNALDAAREFIRNCVHPSPHHTLLVPDKDADGLSATKILYTTLQKIGLPKSHIHLHFLTKGSNVHAAEEKETMSITGCTRLIVLDQGSRPGPSFVRPRTKRPNTLNTPGDLEVKSLLIDHHYSHSFPDNTSVLTACHSPPISTTSLLTYYLCSSLEPSIKENVGWVALLGVYGDLGSGTVKFGKDGWGCPELADQEKKWTKKRLGEAVSMLNAPRRTSDFNVKDAWDALDRATSPSDVANASILRSARERVNKEVTRCQAAAPKFGKDGRVALVRIVSDCQVHPVIATRWAGTLKNAKKLVAIICANDGYTPGITHFSARISSKYRSLPDDERPNLIELLKEYGALAEARSPGWLTRVGNDFARGHKEATGGIIASEEFEILAQAMEIGIKPEKQESPKKVKKIDESQKSNLDQFFRTSTKSSGEGPDGISTDDA